MKGLVKKMTSHPLWRRRAEADLIWITMVLSLLSAVAATVSMLVFWVGMSLSHPMAPQSSLGGDGLRVALLIFTFTCVFGAIQGLVATPIVTALLYKKRLGPSVAWLFGSSMVVALASGAVMFFLAPVAVGVTMVFASVVLRFALNDWVANWRCQSCGYDLRGAPAGPCPECGGVR